MSDEAVPEALTEHVTTAVEAEAAALLSLRLQGCNCNVELHTIETTAFSDYEHHWHVDAEHDFECPYMMRLNASAN